MIASWTMLGNRPGILSSRSGLSATMTTRLMAASAASRLSMPADVCDQVGRDQAGRTKGRSGQRRETGNQRQQQLPLDEPVDGHDPDRDRKRHQDDIGDEVRRERRHGGYLSLPSVLNCSISAGRQRDHDDGRVAAAGAPRSVSTPRDPPDPVTCADFFSSPPGFSRDAQAETPLLRGRRVVLLRVVLLRLCPSFLPPGPTSRPSPV